MGWCRWCRWCSWGRWTQFHYRYWDFCSGRFDECGAGLGCDKSYAADIHMQGNATCRKLWQVAPNCTSVWLAPAIPHMSVMPDAFARGRASGRLTRARQSNASCCKKGRSACSTALIGEPGPRNEMLHAA